MGVGVIGVIPIYIRKPQKLIFLHLDFCKATKQPFKLNVFGIFGIFVLLLGISSMFIFYYYMKEIYFKWVYQNKLEIL